MCTIVYACRVSYSSIFMHIIKKTKSDSAYMYTYVYVYIYVHLAFLHDVALYEMLSI